MVYNTWTDVDDLGGINAHIKKFKVVSFISITWLIYVFVFFFEQIDKNKI